MLKAEQIKSLSQNNQSADVQKTKERIKALWGPLDSQSRAEILKLCGLTKFTIQRTYKVGAISAKLVSAMAQTLKINPYYLTGESDELNCDYTDDTLLDFLRDKSITVAKSGRGRKPKDDKSIVAKAVRNVRGPGKKTLAAIATAAPAEAIERVEPSGNFERDAVNELSRLAGELFASLPSAKKDRIEKISEDELSVLLNGLVMRARFNGDGSNLLKLVKYVLSC